MFALITIGLIGLIFLGANFIPSIWDAFQFTGATAAVCLCFIFPASITLRSALSSQSASERTSSKVDSRMSDLVGSVDANHEQKIDPWFTFQNLFNHPWLQRGLNRGKASGIRSEGSSSTEYAKPKLEPNPFLPKITMAGISTAEGRQMNKASLKKTMEDLTKELEQADQGNATGSSVGDEYKTEERDPLFVGNVGDYYPGLSKTSSPRWVRGVNN